MKLFKSVFWLLFLCNSLFGIDCFDGDKYKSEIDVVILKNSESNAHYIKVSGERIILENFHGDYKDRLETMFGKEIVKQRNELRDLFEIFGEQSGMSTYADRTVWDEEKIYKKIERDASRPFNGDLFSGFAIIEKKSNKIIGRISLGHGYDNGESEMGIIINKDYRNQKYGTEAWYLAFALADVYYDNQWVVGDPGEEEPIRCFTASALDTNAISIKMIDKMGLKPTRYLTEEENYSDDPRKLYTIPGGKIADVLNRVVGSDKISQKVITVNRENNVQDKNKDDSAN